MHADTDPRIAARSRSSRAGFTLVELLVAIALMVILTGSVVFIFMQAQQIFVTVDARVQVYQYARYAFDQMERDLANVVRSTDMDFFDDMPSTNTVGRYDPGEHIPIRGSEDSLDYKHAFTIRQPDVYTGTDTLQHRHDSIYFKTITIVGGENTAALVEYALTDMNRERPRLIKRLWHITGADRTNPLRPRFQLNGTPGDQAQPIVQDLCLYTVDVRYEAFVRNRRRVDPGTYYGAEALVTPPQLPPANERPFEPARNYWAGTEHLVQTFYDEEHNRTASPAAQPDYGIFDPREGTRGMLHTTEYFSFPMLREGDRLFISSPPGTPAASRIRAQEVTIRAFRRANGDLWTARDPNTQGPIPITELRLEFRETVETPGGSTNPVQVRYIAGWLPPAVRCTLVIKDSKSLEYRTISRVFKILSN